MITCDYCNQPITGRIYDRYWVGWTPRVCEKCFEDPTPAHVEEKYKRIRSEEFKSWLLGKPVGGS